MSSTLLWDNIASTVQFTHFVYRRLGISIKVHSSNFATVVPQQIEGSRRNSGIDVWDSEFGAD